MILKKLVIGKESCFSLYIFLCFWILDNVPMLFIQNFKLNWKVIPRTKSSLWNIWVQTPFSTHSGWQFKQHFLDIPVAPSTLSELLPLPALGVLGKILRKRSLRKSLGLETNTLIFGFPQKGFFSARGLRGKLEPECEGRAYYFSC